jgi:UDP-N-acetylmuramoyl-L-alanyl-D-glutamate--2,6-diaminopimelate ligase
MELSALLKRVGVNCTEKATDAAVTGISFNSHTTTEGDLFVAVAGSEADGHDFISDAARNGAVAVIGERDPAEVGCPVQYFRVGDSRHALALLAQEFFGNPSQQALTVGVTGTNGKTSTVIMTGAVLERGGYPACLLNTLGYRVGTRVHPASQTTPDPVLIARMMREAVETNHAASVIEVSSHALDQDRVDGIDFDAAVFTNLTQDHLDYHGDMEHYFLAKLKLFQFLDAPGSKSREKVAVLNAHDPASKRIAGSIYAKKMFYGRTADCDVRAADVVVKRERTVFALLASGNRCDVSLRLTGEHNVLNALGAACVGVHLGLPLETIVEGLESVEAVPGRFESVVLGQPFSVIVDYAHTDDGLRNLISAARAVTSGRVIVVFGCGGDRDRTKRPKMGRVAATLADYIIVTSDNPRSEDPGEIVREAEQGIIAAGKQRGAEYQTVVDRRDAIEQAISLASDGDLVLIAGKGHETQQIFADRTVEFDDRAVTREILEGKGWGKPPDEAQ